MRKTLKKKIANRGTNKVKGSRLQSLILFLHLPRPLHRVILWIYFAASQVSPLLLFLPASTLAVVSVTSCGDSYRSNLVLCLLLLLSRLSHVRLCNPIDGSPLGSPIPGILQARTLEWVAISLRLQFLSIPIPPIDPGEINPAERAF